jgi:hypothetical protein
LFRQAIDGETILTIVSGKLETIKLAKDTDVILRNIEIGGSAELYAINEESFKKRYSIEQDKTLLIVQK